MRSRSRYAAVLALGATLGLGACTGDLKASDLPEDIVKARPQITAEEAAFVLDANTRGAKVTGATVNEDVETGTTTCWALKSGELTLGDIARDGAGEPLKNEDAEGLRTKQLMAAAASTLCPDYASQVPQLNLPT